jgi:hypothetical protein
MHRKGNPIPEGGEKAWAIYSALSGSAVRAFGLHREAIATVDADLEPAEASALLDALNEIEAGVAEARKILEPSTPGGGRR